MPLAPNGQAPYTTTPAVTTFLNRCRVQLPKEVTTDVLIKIGIKETIVPRTLQSLRLLDLLKEDGQPTETLEALSKARPDQYKDELASWLRSVYADVFTYAEPSAASSDEIRNAFWGYEPRGQIDSMIRLFLGLCEEAGIVEGEKRVPSSPKASPRRSTEAGAAFVKKQLSRGTKAPPVDSLGDLPAGLIGLLRDLPSSKRWTKADRDAFLAAFTGVLDYTIRVGEPDVLEESA